MTWAQCSPLYLPVALARASHRQLSGQLLGSCLVSSVALFLSQFFGWANYMNTRENTVRPEYLVLRVPVCLRVC